MSAKFKGKDLRSRLNQLRQKRDEESDDISLSSVESLRAKSPIRIQEKLKSTDRNHKRSTSPYRVGDISRPKSRSPRSRSPKRFDRRSKSPIKQRSRSPLELKAKASSRHHKKSKEKRSRSKALKKSKKKSKKKKKREDTSPISSVSLSPERPPRRIVNDRRPFRPKRTYPPIERQSWEDKVSEFMNKITNTKVADEPEPEPEIPPPEDIKLTPLMKFIASKLSLEKQTLILTGPFQYNILSLSSRAEWVAAKSVKLLEEAGHDNDWLYDTAAIKGASGLKQDLLESLNSNKIVSMVCLKGQMRKIFKLVIKYFTDEDVEIEIGQQQEEEDAEAPANGGLAAVLDRIQASAPPPPPAPEPPTQEINHWSMLADNIQASSLNSFEKLESYLSQDLLRLSSNNKEQAKELLKINHRPAKDAFEVSRNMVMCWVNTGYSFPQLWSMVNQSNVEDILPPRDPNDTSGFNIIGPKNDKYLASKYLHQLKHLNKSMNEKQVCIYLITLHPKMKNGKNPKLTDTFGIARSILSTYWRSTFLQISQDILSDGLGNQNSYRDLC